MADIYISLKPQVCNHHCIILFSVKWIKCQVTGWSCDYHPLLASSHGVTTDTPTIPAHCSAASLPPQGLESIVQLSMVLSPWSHWFFFFEVLTPHRVPTWTSGASRAYRILSIPSSPWFRENPFFLLFSLQTPPLPAPPSSIGLQIPPWAGLGWD